MATKQKQSAAEKGGKLGEDATDTAQQAGEQAGDQASEAGSAAGDQTDGVFSELKDTAREAALAVLKPAVKSVSKSAAEYAVTKGPQVLKDQLGPKLEEAGGLEGLADKALSNAGPGGKVASKLGMGGKLVEGITGDDDDGGEADLDATGSGCRMPVQQGMYVAAPMEVVYAHWTEYEEYPSFMHRVDSVSQEDDCHITFTEKVWGFGRDFEAEIVEQRPYERIAWRSVNGLKHAGVVTFHEMGPRLVRVEVTVDFKPESLFQKFARGNRFSKRAIRADMHRFKAYAEIKEEANEEVGWFGRIEDGEVAESDEEARERLAAEEGEQPADEEAEAGDEGAEEEGYAEEGDAAEEEPEAEEESAEEDEGAEEEPETEAEEADQAQPQRRRQPKRQASRRSRSGGGSGGGGGRRRPQRPRQPKSRAQDGGQKRGSRQSSGSRSRTKSSAR